MVCIDHSLQQQMGQFHLLYRVLEYMSKRQKCNMWAIVALARFYISSASLCVLFFIFFSFVESFHHFLLSIEQKRTIFHTFLFPKVEINNFNFWIFNRFPQSADPTLPLLRVDFLENSSQPWILQLLMDKFVAYKYGKKYEFDGDTNCPNTYLFSKWSGLD